MKFYKKNEQINYKGYNAFISALNPNGTATVHYAAGSGKSGYAGTIPAVKSDYARTSNVARIQSELISEDDGDIVTLAAYNSIIDIVDEATQNGYARGRSDMAQKMRLVVKKQLATNPSEHLQWMHDRLAEIEESEYVTVDGVASPYKTVQLTDSTMKPYNLGHGVGMKDLRGQVGLMVDEYLKGSPEAEEDMKWFTEATRAEKKKPVVKPRTADGDKTPQDFLRLARYMYRETIAHPGEPKRHAGYKRYQTKVMELYGLSAAAAYELITGNLSNEQGKDPEPLYAN
jgi:hypothetical protein